MFVLIKRILDIKAVRVIGIASLVIYTLHHVSHERHQETLRILTWSEVLPLDLLQKFEKEKNVRLIIDYFDSQEVLETKLNSGFSGYDLITPTATSFLARYIQKELLRPIQMTHLKNYKNIAPIFWDKMKVIDPTNSYLVPFGYGTFGILYNKTMIDRLKLSPYPTHYGYFFDPKIVCQWRRYGIGLLNEWQEVFGAALSHLGYPSYTHDKRAIYAAYKMMTAVRGQIRRFSNNRYINDLLVEELIYTQALSDEASRAIVDAKDNKINLVFVRPAQEKGMYIDCFSIPKTARSVKLAEEFIDFCLNNENAIHITKHSKIPNTVSHRFQNQLDPTWFLDVPVEQLSIPAIRPTRLNRELLTYWQHFLQKLPLAPPF